MIWKRLKGLFGGDAEPVEATAKALRQPAPTAEPAARQETSLQAKWAAAVAGDEPEAMLALIPEVEGSGGGEAALEDVLRWLRRGDAANALRLWAARRLEDRGDDASAGKVLAPLVEEAADVPALVMAAEIAERLGDDERARRAWELVLSWEGDHARAQARLRMLREQEQDRQPVNAGATVATEGALARGRYRILRQLGRGGAGTVFAAMDMELGRQVALKIYHRRGAAEMGRLLTEARVPAKLEHPGVVRIHDVDLELGAIAMAWQPDGSLRDRLLRPVTTEQCLGWLNSAVDCLGFVHAAGVVHRDIKPSNLLLRGDGVVFTDFGLAENVGDTAAGARLPDGTVVGEGSLGYMPPEQEKNVPAAASADLYALGKAFLEVIDLGNQNDALPALVALLKQCIADEPDVRPTLEELAGYLKQRS